MFLQLLVSFLLAWYIIIKWKRRHLEKLSGQFKPALRTLPLIGHTYLLAGNNEERMKGFQKLGRMALKTGGLTPVWHAHKLFIMVADPEVAEIVLKNCLEKDDLMEIFQFITGDGSIFTSVAKWRPRRKFLAPTFNMKNLNRFVGVFAAQSGIMVEKLKSLAGTGPSSMWKVFSTYTMDAVCGTTLGIVVKAQDNPNHPFLVALDESFQIAANRMCKVWLSNEFIFKQLPQYQTVVKHKAMIYEFVDKIVTMKRKDKEDKQLPTKEITVTGLKPFVELMMESAIDESDVAIREECLVILAAGTDTSAVGLGYCALMLAEHPAVQEKVYQEINAVFGDETRPVEANDLHHLKYLEAVIKETIRLYPPVPLITRMIEKEVKLPSGVTLIPGCGVIVNIWAIHRNPAYWGEDAEQFRPERFLESPLRHPAAFMPFSFGPRNCLGYQYAMMSMKTALTTLLRKYRVVSATAPVAPPTASLAAPFNAPLNAPPVAPLRVKYDIMMRHVDNYCLGIEYRK